MRRRRCENILQGTDSRGDSGRMAHPAASGHRPIPPNRLLGGGYPFLPLFESFQGFRQDLSAINDDRLAGDVVRLFRCQEQGGVTDILDDAEFF